MITGQSPSKTATPSKQAAVDEPDYSSGGGASDPDNSFNQFYQLCQRLEKEPGYNAKTKIISDYIKFGTSGGI